MPSPPCTCTRSSLAAFVSEINDKKYRVHTQTLTPASPCRQTAKFDPFLLWYVHSGLTLGTAKAHHGILVWLICRLPIAQILRTLTPFNLNPTLSSLSLQFVADFSFTFVPNACRCVSAFPLRLLVHNCKAVLVSRSGQCPFVVYQTASECSFISTSHLR